MNNHEKYSLLIVKFTGRDFVVDMK